MKLLRKTQQQPARRSNYSSGRQARPSQADLNDRYTFRRNRTLTGSLASGVASAGEHRAEFRSSRVQVHDLRHHRRRLFGVLLAVVATSAGLFSLIYQSIAIPHVVADTPVPIDSVLYEGKIQDYLNGRPMERFRFALDTDALTSYLQSNGLPEVKAISRDMQFSGFGVSDITLTLRRPTVAWKTRGVEVFVDDRGVAFERNYYTQPGVKIVDRTGIQAQDGRVLASDRFLGFIGLLIGAMKAQGYTVTQVALPAATTRQVEVSIDGVSYPIKFSVDRPAGEQSEDAARSIRYLASKGMQVEYLDVRVSGKAYYK